MIFRQLFDSVSGTYTYLLASRRGGEALIIDPVLEKVDRYLQLVERTRPQAGQGGRHPPARRPHHRPGRAARPHPLHHRDGRAAARPTWCRCGSSEGDKLTIEGLALDVLYTPGHTDDSYSFLMRDRVFTGDTLLIRGTGRTDFQNGDPRAQYDSIFNKLLRLPDETMVFPAHDYKGETVSTIGEEKAFNPRLQVKSVDEYVELMNNLNLPNPKMMDVAVPANMRVGLPQEEIARRGWAVSAAEALALVGRPDVTLVDLRERTEREKHGVHPRLAARALPRPCGQCPARRHAARARQRHRQAHRVLLRLRRTLGHGGAGRAGRRACLGRSHSGRHRRLEESPRATGGGMTPCPARLVMPGGRARQ